MKSQLLKEEKKQDNKPFDNPLIKAIKTNDAETLRVLLKEGKKPDFRYAFTGLENNDTDPKILDLLVEYDALPEGASLSTLKFTLFALGNTRISVSDFWDKPDLNLNGFPHMQSPMQLFTKKGNVQSVAALIQKGVTERPIHFFFAPYPAPFIGTDLLDVSKFKERTSVRFDVNKDLGRLLEGQCKVAELLLSNPTEELDKFFAKKKEEPLFSDDKFLLLFAWAAKDNRAYLLDVPHFKRLFQEGRSYKEAVVVAAAFGSIEFLTKAMQENLLDAEDIEEASSIAAANGDNELLASLMEPLGKNKENKDISMDQTTREMSGTSSIKHFKTLLRWAVPNDHYDTAEFLLKAGASPNEFEENNIWRGSHLLTATYYDNTDLMKLLLSYGANIDHQDYSGRSALHMAAKRNNLEALKILIAAGADIDLADKKGHRPLDSIKDDAVRKDIQDFVKERDESQSLDDSISVQNEPFSESEIQTCTVDGNCDANDNEEEVFHDRMPETSSASNNRGMSAIQGTLGFLPIYFGGKTIHLLQQNARLVAQQLQNQLFGTEQLVVQSFEPHNPDTSMLSSDATAIQLAPSSPTMNSDDVNQSINQQHQPYCMPALYGEEQTPILQCMGSDYSILVFPKTSSNTQLSTVHIPTSSSGITGDTYAQSSCRPVEFYGQPSVYCEGEQTTVVYTLYFIRVRPKLDVKKVIL